jgi:hypothetical protein
LKIAELIETNPEFNLQRYNPKEIKKLAVNIFPHGKTVLHYGYKNLKFIQEFYKTIEDEITKAKDREASKNKDVSN